MYLCNPLRKAQKVKFIVGSTKLCQRSTFNEIWHLELKGVGIQDISTTLNTSNKKKKYRYFIAIRENRFYKDPACEWPGKYNCRHHNHRLEFGNSSLRKGSINGFSIVKMALYWEPTRTKVGILSTIDWATDTYDPLTICHAIKAGTRLPIGEDPYSSN